MSETNVFSGSIANYLAEHIGREVIAEFQCGSDDPVRKAGTLIAVQDEFIVLRDDMSLRETVCSLDHLCFITFYLSGTLPRNDVSTENGGNGGTASGISQPQPRPAAMAALSHTMRKGR